MKWVTPYIIIIFFSASFSQANDCAEMGPLWDFTKQIVQKFRQCSKDNVNESGIIITSDGAELTCNQIIERLHERKIEETKESVSQAVRNAPQAVAEFSQEFTMRMFDGTMVNHYFIDPINSVVATIEDSSEFAGKFTTDSQFRQKVLDDFILLLTVTLEEDTPKLMALSCDELYEIYCEIQAEIGFEVMKSLTLTAAGLGAAKTMSEVYKIARNFKANRSGARFLDIVRTKLSRPFTAGRRKRVDRYIQGQLAGRKEFESKNPHYIDNIDSPENKTHLHYENAITREMNGSLFSNNKTLTDAVTYRSHAILREEILKEPIGDGRTLGDIVNLEYYDYKQARMTFSERSDSINEALQRVTQRTNERLRHELVDSGLISPYLNRNAMRGLSQDPMHWFQAGIGSSMDQAGTAARISRNHRTPGRAGIMQYNQITRELTENLRSSEALRERSLNSIRLQVVGRNELTREQMSTSARRMFEFDSSGKPLTFSTEFEEVFRRTTLNERNESAYFSSLREQIRARFNVELDQAQIRNIRSYFNSTDQFAPGLLIRNRDLPNLGTTNNGLYSFDMIGLSARDSTQRRLALIGERDPNRALERAREAERSVTRETDLARNRAGNAFNGTTSRTGDEGLSAPLARPSRGEMMSTLQRLSSANRSDIRFRSAYAHPERIGGRPLDFYGQRNLTTAGENLLKDVTKRLEKDLSYDFMRENDMMIEVRAPRRGSTVSLSTGEARIYMTKPIPENQINSTLNSILSEFRSACVWFDRACLIVVPPDRCIGLPEGVKYRHTCRPGRR